ncbi:hypothetical protein Peur_027594 [Populus x canadensis]
MSAPACAGADLFDLVYKAGVLLWSEFLTRESDISIEQIPNICSSCGSYLVATTMADLRFSRAACIRLKFCFELQSSVLI